MGNPFKKDKPEPTPTAATTAATTTPTVDAAPDKVEVAQAKTQAKTTTRRRRGTMGTQRSLLSGGYRGFLDQDTLG